MFQSTPAIADGRTAAHLCCSHRSRRFQSTPAIADGRTALPPNTLEQDMQFQSTPAIADGRTLAARPHPKTHEPCFNPRPPSLTGEPGIACGVGAAQEVSIHARHR